MGGIQETNVVVNTVRALSECSDGNDEKAVHVVGDVAGLGWCIGIR
jgi:hypothetical protein